MTDLFWRAVYDDGSTLCELDGPQYKDINRDRLTALEIVNVSRELVHRFEVPVGHTGHNLVYRRSIFTSSLGGPERKSMLVGFMPGGPAYSFWMEDPDVFYKDPSGFHPVGPHTCGIFGTDPCIMLQSPIPHPHEGEPSW